MSIFVKLISKSQFLFEYDLTERSIFYNNDYNQKWIDLFGKFAKLKRYN